MNYKITKCFLMLGFNFEGKSRLLLVPQRTYAISQQHRDSKNREHQLKTVKLMNNIHIYIKINVKEQQKFSPLTLVDIIM